MLGLPLPPPMEPPPLLHLEGPHFQLAEGHHHQWAEDLRRQWAEDHNARVEGEGEGSCLHG